MFGRFFILIPILFVSACGGDSPTSGSSPEESSVGGYAEEISYATTEIVKRAIASESAPISLRSLRKPEKIKASRGAEYFPSVRAVESESETTQGDCGGVIITTTSVTTPDNSELAFPMSMRSEAEYQDYCVGDEEFKIVFNGSFLYSFDYLSSEEYSFLYEYNLSYFSNTPFYPSGIISENERCTKAKGEQEICTSLFLYENSGGEEYTFTEVEINGSSSSGYSLSGVVSDEESNDFNISVSNFTQCDTGNIQTGTIEIEGSNGEIVSISFPNCSECIISYQGVSETFPQN